MKKNVLFIVGAPGKPQNYTSIMPPIGVLGLASYLESWGYSCDVIDYNVEKDRSLDFREYGWVCFSVLASNIEKTVKQINDVKQQNPAAQIIIGGPYVRSNPQFFLNIPEVNVLISGEAEETLHEFLKKGCDPTVLGLYLRDANGKARFTGKRPVIMDLDRLPFPALDKVDIKKYNWPVKRRRPISTIVTSRGCPEQCIFCSHSLGFEWRFRSAKHVVDELDWQVNELGVQEVCFFDDNFSLDLKRAEKICDLIKERKLDFTFQFPNGLRADRLNRHLLQQLKDAGCWYLALAPETGSDRVLKTIKKRFTLDKVQEIVRDCKEIGIRTMGLYMIGFPFETREDIEKTITFSQKLDTDLAQFAKVTIFADTELAMMYGYEATNNEEDKALKTGLIQHEVPGISKEDVYKYSRQAYRGFYLRPKKMYNLVHMLRPTDLVHLAQYAISNKNM